MESIKHILVGLGLIWGPLVAIGAGVDLFTLRLRLRIHDYLSECWLQLAEARVPNMPAQLAVLTLHMAHKAYLLKLPKGRGATIWEKSGTSDCPTEAGRGILVVCAPLEFGRRSIFAATIISIFLTLIVGVVGTFVGTNRSLVSAIRVNFSTGFAFILLGIPPNVLFDTLTMAVTLHILSIIARSSGVAVLALILLDLSLAVVFGLGAVTLQDYTTSVVTYAYGPAENMRFLIGGLIWLFAPESPSAIRSGVFPLFYAATTFIPTAIFLTFLAVVVIAHGIARGGRQAGVFILGAATDYPKDRLPAFTMLGSLIAAVLSVAFLIHLALN